MTKSIFPESYFIDGTLQKILLKLIEKKKKFDYLKSRHILMLWVTIFFTSLYFMYIYKHIAMPYSYSFASMFSAYVSHIFNLYALIIVIGSFGFVNVLKQKREKAEKEYHELRCEIIDKSKDLITNSDTWENRHEIYNVLKNQYDINLFHQAK
ncbi:DUF2663 family protein [Bacillus sp. B1-b2]|uniref:DUF2663 family protein n=1 Tax=Bacillus sp. B1-b2 TaxID=2653201 RepID=UPI0012624667|nr:DUF2663 family protein [Bacillus sp. B1-b2]KAB7672907.1 DUF2663 family protein [Bacillus sp. B1-b2]